MERNRMPYLVFYSESGLQAQPLAARFGLGKSFVDRTVGGATGTPRRPMSVLDLEVLGSA